MRGGGEKGVEGGVYGEGGGLGDGRFGDERLGKGVTPLCCGKGLDVGVVGVGGRVVGWWSGVVGDRGDGLVSSSSKNSRIE